MNPQELELAGKILSEIRNSTGYGYETLVNGTVLSNGLDLIGVVAWCLSMVLVTVYTWQKWELGGADSDRFGAYVGFLAILAIVLVFVYAVCLDAILGICAPEYTVLNKIIETAVAQ